MVFKSFKTLQRFSAALHSLEAIMCHKFLRLIELADLLNFEILQVLFSFHDFDETLRRFVRYKELFEVVKIQNY